MRKSKIKNYYKKRQKEIYLKQKQNQNKIIIKIQKKLKQENIRF